jgi:uncharacterized protein
MSNRLLVAGVAYSLLCPFQNGIAAGFDCAQAKGYVEKSICASTELSDLDDTLGAAFRAASTQGAASERVRKDQLKWLRNRNSCREESCIRESYLSRIRELGGGASTIQGNAKGICEYVANMGNSGKLEDVVLKGKGDGDTLIPVPADLEHYGVVFRDRVDINNDGRPEHVYITSQGTGHYEELAIYDSRMREIEVATAPGDDWESANLRWATDRRIIRYGGAYYFIGKTDDYLHYVAKIGPDNVEKVVCEFDQKRDPSARVTVSRNDRVCQAALQGTLDYVPFDKLHALTYADMQRANISETSLAEMAAGVDIDNDGKADYVVTTQFASGAGRGCDSYGLAVLADTRTALADSPTAKLLLEIDRVCGGDRVLPFQLDGKVYLEHKYADGHPTNVHSVYKIENGKRDVICGMETRVVNYVLSQYEALVSTAESNYKNPWKYAMEQPSLKQVKLLVDGGRNINEVIQGETPVGIAVWSKRDDALEFLLNHGADPNGMHGSLSPLFFAINNGTDRSVVLLLKHGAQLKIPNSDPITEIIRRASVSKLRAIVDSGIGPEERHLAMAKSQTNPNAEIIQILEGAMSRQGGQK